MRKNFYIAILSALILCLCVLCCAHAAVSQVLVLPESTKVIEAEAFYGNTSIQEVVLPEGVESIGERAFANSGVTKVNLPETLTYIAPDAFDRCDGVTVIVVAGTAGEEYAKAANVKYEYVRQETPAEDFTYTIENGECTITGYIGTTVDVVIPSEIEGYEVTRIEKRAFYQNNVVTSVDIPDTMVSINDYAFYCCTSLTSITIPNTVTSIGYCSYNNCTSLTSIFIPDSVTFIDDYAFNMCASLTSISIPDGIASIGEYSFFRCGNLSCISIPDSVISIGNCAFSYCTSLTSVSIPDGVASIGYCSFSNCTGLTSISIPDSVTFIDGYAFSNCKSLTSISIPDSVTFTGDGIFSNCTSLTNASISNNITSIAGNTFSNCTSLTEIAIPDSVTSIGEQAFNSCTSLTSITIPDSVTSIGGWAFRSCTRLTSISIPDSVTSIGEGAFYSCTNLISITIPDSVTSISGWAFSSCKNLTYVTIPDSVTSIGEAAFYGCTSLTSIFIPDSVTSIENNTFSNCSSMSSISIPDSVTYIGEQAFSSCTSLTSITIPDDVTSIDRWAFSGCTRLTSISIPDSVTSIGGMVFQRCTSLTNITIPNSVTSIGGAAFYGCTSLTSISIPNGVTSIKNNTFDGCTNLTSIAIPNSVTSIEYSAFTGCESLTIYGEAGSYTETYAEENAIPFKLGIVGPTEDTLPAEYYEIVNTYSYSGNTYFEANLIKDYNGVKAGTSYEGRHFFLNSHGEVVTEPATLCKLFTISLYTDFEDDQHNAMKQWKSVANTCAHTTKQFMQAQSLSKILGEATGGAIASYLKALMTGDALKLTDILDVVVSVPSSETVVCVSAEMMYINLLLDHFSESVDYAVSSSVQNKYGAYDYDLVENALAWYRYNASVYHAVQEWSVPVVNMIHEDYSSGLEMTFDLFGEFWNSMWISGIDNLGMGLMNEVFKKWMMAETGAIQLLDSLLYIGTSDPVQWGISYFENSMIVLSQCFGIDLDDMSELTAGFYMTVNELKTTQLYKNHLLLAQ